MSIWIQSQSPMAKKERDRLATVSFFFLAFDADHVRPLGVIVQIHDLNFVAIRLAGLNLSVGKTVFIAEHIACVFGLLDARIDLLPLAVTDLTIHVKARNL